MNMFALYIVVVSVNLFILLSLLSRALIKPDTLVEEIERVSRYISRSAPSGSRKKREIVSFRVAIVRKKIFVISMTSAIIPIIGMSLVFTYLVLSFGEHGAATLSLCSLPPPVTIWIEGQCLIYSPWLVFLSYLLIMPLYNYLSGIDLLRGAGREGR